MAQADWYVNHGLPQDFGVWWAGLLIRSAKCPSFGDSWLAEMVRWTIQDQISLPWVLYSIGLYPKPLSSDVFGHMVLTEHNRQD